MKLLRDYEYTVRVALDNKHYYGNMHVDVYSTVIHYSITYDGWENPSIVDSCPVKSKSQIDPTIVFKSISRSLLKKYKIIII